MWYTSAEHHICGSAWLNFHCTAGQLSTILTTTDDSFQQRTHWWPSFSAGLPGKGRPLVSLTVWGMDDGRWKKRKGKEQEEEREGEKEEREGELFAKALRMWKTEEEEKTPKQKKKTQKIFSSFHSSSLLSSSSVPFELTCGM